MYVIVGIIVSFITFKIYFKLTTGKCTCKTILKDKVVIVTGSNTGIGYETAKDLALRGAKVILACRDQKKANKARAAIIRTTGNHNVIYKQLDLASFKSIRTFAEDIIKIEPVLHILINNAGTGKLDNSLTEDNLPVETQINHFGPFLLTTLLLPLLRKSAPSRIVNVSSLMHRFGYIDFEKFHNQASSWWAHSRVYSNTKLANVLFTNKLSRELQGTGVTANCLHPGLVSTDIFRDKPLWVQYLIRLGSKSPLEGAQTTIHLAVAPELHDVTGKYFTECEETETSTKARDIELADKLWQFSEKIVSPTLNY